MGKFSRCLVRSHSSSCRKHAGLNLLNINAPPTRTPSTSMIAGRRWASPIDPSMWMPSPSGPRCTRSSDIRRIKSRSTAPQEVKLPGNTAHTYSICPAGKYITRAEALRRYLCLLPGAFGRRWGKQAPPPGAAASEPGYISSGPCFL